MRYSFILYVFSPCLLALVIGFWVYKKPVYVITGEALNARMELNLTSYNDIDKKGTSQIQVSQEKSLVKYNYTLREGFAFPYVGITLSKKDTSLFDLSEFDIIKIKIKASKGKRIPITITTHIDGYSKKDLDLSYRSSQVVLNTNPKISEISTPINSFETPTWWYSENNLSEIDLKKPDFSKVKTIQLNNCISLPKNIEDLVEVEELSFHKDYSAFYLGGGFIYVVYLGLGYLVLFRKKEDKKTKVNFQYEKTTSSINYEDKEEELIFSFITSNYSNSELTIIDVQKSIGIHERKISTVIKNRTDLNFKQFLNTLRISEAKRLLLTTNMQISEIAFKVGYGNASHFNRVFKISENCAPNDFRKKGQNS